jgi:hypothetical protein
MSEQAPNGGAYQIINPPNLLKVKLGSGDSPGFDTESIRRAESAFDSLEEEFEDRVSAELMRLVKLARDIEEDPTRSAKTVRRVARVCRELIGQGENYDFELVTQIAKRLVGYIERIGDNDINPQVLRAHADALRAVFKNDVKGSGGEVGMALLVSLDKLIERMAP